MLLSRSNTCKNKYSTTFSIKIDMFRGCVSNQRVFKPNIILWNQSGSLLNSFTIFSKVNLRQILSSAKLPNAVRRTFRLLRQSRDFDWSDIGQMALRLVVRKVTCCAALPSVCYQFCGCVSISLLCALVLIEQKPYTTCLILNIYILRNASQRKRWKFSLRRIFDP